MRRACREVGEVRVGKGVWQSGAAVCRTITLAMGVPTCPREHHGALGARVSQNLSRLRRSDHLTAILIGVGSGVFIIAAGRIFRQIIVVHTASAANRRLVSTADFQ